MEFNSVFKGLIKQAKFTLV